MTLGTEGPYDPCATQKTGPSVALMQHRSGNIKLTAVANLSENGRHAKKKKKRKEKSNVDPIPRRAHVFFGERRGELAEKRAKLT